MASVDPTYPLYPIACLLASLMLLLVLLTNFIRHSWNLGIAFLCFWLCVENLTGFIDTVVWADNNDIKFYIYCDISTHIEVITSVVKPMATLIITRRLYLITSLRSMDLPSKTARRIDLVMEWALGLLIPLVVAGPFYYTVQLYRFGVIGGFGCVTTTDDSVVAILLILSWNVVPPILSITIYYPRAMWILYHQRRDIHEFLQSDNSVSRTNYFRILALASIDIFLTLPIGIVTIVLAVSAGTGISTFPVYSGWKTIHSHQWGPVAIPGGLVSNAQLYFVHWTSPVLAFTIFGLFGVTREARASYWRAICTVGGRFGWKPTLRARRAARSTLGTMEFGDRTREHSVDLEIGSRPSFIDQTIRPREESEGNPTGHHVAAEKVEDSIREQDHTPHTESKD
ncbi:unnamed protein product [Peniophora sp. CBMAI 1063]|nr:unnamed protein product [Peniophora sp. CBMAI 1063]